MPKPMNKSSKRSAAFTSTLTPSRLTAHIPAAGSVTWTNTRWHRIMSAGESWTRRLPTSRVRGCNPVASRAAAALWPCGKNSAASLTISGRSPSSAKKAPAQAAYSSRTRHGSKYFFSASGASIFHAASKCLGVSGE